MTLLQSPGAVARDIALGRVKAAADIDWLTACRNVIRRLALTRDTFTSDDVWEGLRKYRCTTPEPRAMGAAFRGAQTEDWIKPLFEWRSSKRPACHARPIRVWKSLLLNPEPVDNPLDKANAQG